MRAKISDFKLVEMLLKKACDMASCPFVDLNLCFDSETTGLQSDCLAIGPSKNIGQTLYKIIEAYINNVKEVDGKVLFSDEKIKEDFLLSTATYLRSILYSDTCFEEATPDEPVALRLYQQAIVWTLLKDLICPVYNKDLVNSKVVAGSSPHVDVSVFCEEKCFDGKEPKSPFIFVNADAANIPIRNVFVLIAALESIGLCPYKTIKDILESELSEQFVGIIKLAFDSDEDFNTFMYSLIGVLGFSIKDFPNLKLVKEAKQTHVKIAQNYTTPAQWWYFGLIEKLLEPVRGADWSTHETLEPYIGEFWDKVESYRNKKKNKEDGVPFDALLRIKSEDCKIDANRPFQDLLGSERIW
tara:strand:- start:1408 stop:2475 length:1068 start_codon:yes stop_codon:yes gene_type:complete